MTGWIILAVFITAWIASIFYLVRVKNVTSAVVGVGGGFLIAAAALVVVGLPVLWYLTADQGQAEAEKSEPPRLCNQSSWDGSVRGVEDYLRANLNDPNYERVEWSNVVARPTGYAVRFKYRARNGFGALILKDQVFSLDEKCQVRFALDYFK